MISHESPNRKTKINRSVNPFLVSESKLLRPLENNLFRYQPQYHNPNILPLVFALRYIVKKTVLSSNALSESYNSSKKPKIGYKLPLITKDIAKGLVQLLPIVMLFGHVSNIINHKNTQIANPAITLRKECAGKIIGAKSAKISRTLSPEKFSVINPILSTLLITSYLAAIGCKDFKSRVPAISLAKFTNYLLDENISKDHLSQNNKKIISASSGIMLHILGEVCRGDTMKNATVRRVSETLIGHVFNSCYYSIKKTIKDSSLIETEQKIQPLRSL